MNIASTIDHTILKADASKEEIISLCNEAKEHGFASVCVNSCHLPLVSRELEGSLVKVCTVVGFPLGATLSLVKAYETKEAIRLGAREIDMVINIGALKDKDYDFVYNDIKAVVDEAAGKATIKVIIETSLLTDDEKIKVCELAVKAGADYVKTSTGFSTGGATATDVLLMKKTVGDKAYVKASGGIRTYDNAMAMIEAGADRIGTSNGVSIVVS